MAVEGETQSIYGQLTGGASVPCSAWFGVALFLDIGSSRSDRRDRQMQWFRGSPNNPLRLHRAWAAETMRSILTGRTLTIIHSSGP